MQKRKVSSPSPSGASVSKVNRGLSLGLPVCLDVCDTGQPLVVDGEANIRQETRQRRQRQRLRRHRRSLSANVVTIGADFHGAMAATAAGEKLLIGRRPVRNWTQLQFASLFRRHCHWQSTIQMVTLYDIKLVFVQKIISVLRKINKNCCHQSCTFWLQYAPNRLSAAASPQISIQRSTRPPSCI